MQLVVQIYKPTKMMCKFVSDDAGYTDIKAVKGSLTSGVSTLTDGEYGWIYIDFSKLPKSVTEIMVSCYVRSGVMIGDFTSEEDSSRKIDFEQALLYSLESLRKTTEKLWLVVYDVS